MSLAFLGICLSGAVIGWVATLHVENRRIARDDQQAADLEKRLEVQNTALAGQLQQSQQALQQARQTNQHLNAQLSQLRSAPRRCRPRSSLGPS